MTAADLEATGICGGSSWHESKTNKSKKINQSV
jgi:hypothetical protein